MTVATHFFSYGGGGIPPAVVWILATGFWNDGGEWDDTASWID